MSATAGKWLLLNASPDLRQQILADAELAPAQGGRNTPIVGIILTSADADSVLGLLHLREFHPLRIFATPSVRRALTKENSLFRVLERSKPPVVWEELPLGRQFSIERSGKMELFCEAVPLGGTFPDYVSSALKRKLRREEAVVGLVLRQGERQFFMAPSLSSRGEKWKRHVKESNLALLDGTFWSDGELVKVQGGGKTARQMGHLPISGPDGLLEKMEALTKTRRVLIHLNNTNPVLDEESAENRAVRDAGWEVAYDGMEFEL